MRILIVHHEAEYFAGAEKVLGYFLEGLLQAGVEVSVAAVRESRVPEIIPPGVTVCWLPPNSRFSLRQFVGQSAALRRFFQSDPCDLVHGWAARDWELTTVAGRLAHRKALGTLHDHPRASFISRSRQRLMRWMSVFGLAEVVCVSEAVRRACMANGYAQSKLSVVHNGLPPLSTPRQNRVDGTFRLGFLGLFSARKGLRGLFEMIDALAKTTTARWELALAGDTQEEEGRKLIAEIKTRYSSASWWPQVHWLGWVKRPMEFLATLDLLICPSAEFDPFPTVLLEAGQAGAPVLAANVGGVPEIVDDCKTGWLFPAQAWSIAATQLKRLVESPRLAAEAGTAARERINTQFTGARMAQDYIAIYSRYARRN